MDFSGVTNETAAGVAAAVDNILHLSISPADKEARIARLIQIIGMDYHGQMYDAAAQVFDATTMASAGMGDANSQAARLANKVVRNYALGRQVDPLILEYYNSVLGSAQHEAFMNAASMQRHPTLTRSIVGENTCTWCISRAGTYVNPTSEDFSRHGSCDCLFSVAGYGSRNGIVNNYVKGRK